MTRTLRLWLLTLFMGGGILLLDRLSKLWVVDNLQRYESLTPIPALEPYFRIFHTTNTGVAFGLFRGGGWVFTALAALAIIGILIYSLRLGHSSPIAYLSLGLLLGGAGGNLWDRLVYGHVIDFLDFRLSDRLYWPTFNLADSAIVVGVILLMIIIYREEQENESESHSAIADPTT